MIDNRPIVERIRRVTKRPVRRLITVGESFSEEQMRESSQEKIYEEIKRRKLESFEHIILNSPTQSGITYLLNHMLRDKYKATEKVSQDLLDALLKFSILLPPNERIATITYDEDDALMVWPRASRTHARIDYDPRGVEIVMPGGTVDYDSKSAEVVMPDGAKAYLWCIFLPARRSEGDVGYFVLSYSKHNFHDVERFLTLIDRFNREIHATAKYVEVYGGTNIRLRGEHHWDDLVLTDEIKHAIKDDLEFWIASEAHYRKRHIPYRRGYLFEGPPGNGKTAVARTILSTYDFAAYSFNFSNPRLDDKDLQSAFEEAANAAPSAFLLEDIDRIFTSAMSYSRVSKEGLFNCLDGVATYSGLIVIATANQPEVLDKAIRHRPGRFDVPVRFANPEYPQREEFVKRLLGSPEEHDVDLRTARYVADECGGMSMAFIKLVYETAAARAFKQRGNLIINTEDLLAGFKQARGYYENMETPDDRSAGFKSKKEERRRRHIAEETENPKEKKIGPCCDEAFLREPTHVVAPTIEPDN